MSDFHSLQTADQGIGRLKTIIITGMENLARLTEDLTHLQLTDSQIQMFRTYEELLVDWNAKINLTAIREPEAIRLKHFLDSLSCALVMRNADSARVVDVGTGAGLPGLALKIAFPRMKLTLIESIGKKARFCELAAETLQFKDVRVHAARAEEVVRLPGEREGYDWAVARAVANLPILVEYLLPFVKVGGCVLAQKGVTAHAEAQAAAKAIQILGGELKQITRVELPGVADERYLIVIEKKFPTPPMYPRSGGLPVKKPLS